MSWRFKSTHNHKINKRYNSGKPELPNNFPFYNLKSNEADKLSLEQVLKALQSLGLSQIEARIYVFLEKSGSREDVDIAQALKINMKRLLINLKTLQDKRIVQASAQQTVEFSAVPFEKAMDLLIEVKKEKAKSLQERKMELLASWQSMIKKDSENN